MKKTYKKHKFKSARVCKELLYNVNDWWFSSLIKERECVFLRPAESSDMFDVAGVHRSSDEREYMVDKDHRLIPKNLLK